MNAPLALALLFPLLLLVTAAPNAGAGGLVPKTFPPCAPKLGVEPLPKAGALLLLLLFPAPKLIPVLFCV